MHPDTTSGEAAFNSSQDILKHLKQHKIDDLDVAYREGESVVHPLAGSQLFASVDNDHHLKDVCSGLYDRFLGAAACPAVPYLASVPISFPLIELTQLVQYLVVCHVANLTPGELRSQHLELQATL